MRNGRITTKAAVGQEGVASMRLAVPAGTISATDFDQIRILVSGWQVRNDGAIAGTIGGHIIVQERGFFGENSIIEGDWVAGSNPPQPRLRTRDLSNPIGSSTVRSRSSISWNPQTVRVAAGLTMNLAFSIVIGLELIEGKSNLDIVVIMDRLPEVSGIDEVRKPNAFNVSSFTPPPDEFSPVALGSPTVEVNPF